MKRLINILVSTRTTGVLLLLYALSMAVATFVENDYGTPVAKALIYNSWWFEMIMVLLIVNFIGNIRRYRLWKREKWPLLTFHLAFIIIFIGGAVTRYISFEGAMHIREGESSDEVISDANFFKVQITDGEQALAYDDVPALLISKDVPFYLKPFRSDYTAEYNFMGKRLKMRVLDYIPRAQDSLIANSNGSKTLQLVTLVNDQRENKYIASGSVQLIQNILVSYNQETPGAINLSDSEGTLRISSPLEGSYMIMATKDNGEVKANTAYDDFHLRALYNFGGLIFVVPQPPTTGKVVHYEGDTRINEGDPDMLIMELSAQNDVDTVSFLGGQGITGFQHQSEVGGLTVSLGYGARIYNTPFQLKLTKFNMEKYPGSNSPAAYSSHVAIVENGRETPYHIYMNHILDQGGYRFFQSSYDPDEKGTVLSVNHDYWGTNITYLGYALLFLGMFVTLFWKGTRFSKLNGQLHQLSKQKAVAACTLLLLSSIPCFPQDIDMHGPSQGNQLKREETVRDSMLAANEQPGDGAIDAPMIPQNNDAAQFAASVKIDQAHATRFGRLLVQNIDGRIEPINTLALEILRKLYHKDSFYSLDANQFLLSATVQPFSWAQVPFIKVGTKGGNSILDAVKANAEGYTSMFNLLHLGQDGQPRFVLEEDYQRAFAKKPAEQNNYDKELIELNDKLQVMQYLLNGQYLRVLPVPDDPNNTWVAWGSEHVHQHEDEDDHDHDHDHGEAGSEPISAESNVQHELFGTYLKRVIFAESSGNWTEADEALADLTALQKTYGEHIIPSETKINLEVRYNSWNIFFKLMMVYALLGTVILLLAFTKLFSVSKWLYNTTNIFLILIIIAALLQAIGLGVRWYISGHAPWSNGYEAVMFISWVGVVSGLVMYRNSNAFIPAAGCLVAVILMGFAHGGSQMNPQITPLVPVLKSYWLMIHVAIITSSYGFFGLSALIGMFSLTLYLINNNKIKKSVAASVNELTIVNEMSLTVGLFLLTIGTFLGGMWANESWGRYWSWDPKETWAFISVIVYAFVLHMRLIPGAKSNYLFNLMSLIAFASVIMTYFGVNYYLSGLHSYAKGDPVPVPSWVYITTGLVILLAVCSYIRFRQHERKDKLNKVPARKQYPVRDNLTT